MQWVILLYALFGSIFTIAKTGLQFTQPFFMVGSRMLVAGILLSAWVAWRDPSQLQVRRFSQKQWFRIFLLGLLGMYFTNAFEFWGLQYLSSFKTCFIYSLSPFFSALLCFLLHGERLTAKKWLGLSIGFVGFIPIFANEMGADESLGHFFYLSWAELAVIAAAASTVCGWVLLGDLIKEDGMSPMGANCLSMLMGGVMSTVHSYFIEDWSPVPVSDWSGFIPMTLLMVLISNIVCYNLYGWLLTRFTPTFLSFAGFLTPLFAACYGFLILGEEITTAFYVSCTIVFTGLAIFYQEELELGVRQEAAVPVEGATS